MLRLVAYFVTMLGAFAVVTILSRPGHEAEMIEDYRGLFWRRPLLATGFTLMLLSLAGIPLTVGFIAKLRVLTAGSFAAAWMPVLVLVATSTVGLYYYLRIVVAMVDAAPARSKRPIDARVGETVVFGTLTLLLVWLGIYPDPLLRMVAVAMTTLGQ